MMSDYDFKAQHEKLKKQWVQLKKGAKFDEELEMLPYTAAELRDTHPNIYNRAFLGGGPVLCKLDLIKLDALCRQRVCRGSGSKQFGSGLLSTPNVQQHGQALAMQSPEQILLKSLVGVLQQALVFTRSPGSERNGRAGESEQLAIEDGHADAVPETPQLQTETQAPHTELESHQTSDAMVGALNAERDHGNLTEASSLIAARKRKAKLQKKPAAKKPAAAPAAPAAKKRPAADADRPVSCKYTVERTRSQVILRTFASSGKQQCKALTWGKKHKFKNDLDFIHFCYCFNKCVYYKEF